MTPLGAAGLTRASDAADRLLRAGSTNYGYDANGNRISRGTDSFS